MKIEDQISKLQGLYFYVGGIFEKGEMGKAGEKWDKMWEEVGHMRLSGLAEIVAVPDVPQEVQTGPDRVVTGVSLVSVTAGPNKASTG